MLNDGFAGKLAAIALLACFGLGLMASMASAGFRRAPEDLSRGYVVYQVQGRRVCVVCTAEGLQVYLDGSLLKEANGARSEH